MSMHLFSMLAAAGVAFGVMLTATPAQADPDFPAAAAWGGGTAVVTNDEGFLPPGVVTSYGLTAEVKFSGEALGEFTCMVHGGHGGLTAKLTSGEHLGEGCIVFYGTSTCVFPGIGVFFDEPITLYVCGGGPGEGGFALCFDNFPQFGCDVETVRTGVIKYHERVVEP